MCQALRPPSKRPLIQWLGLAALLLWGGWSAGRPADPLVRQTFTLQTPGGAPFAGMVVRPRMAGPHPVVIFAHAAGGRLTNDVTDLRPFAELGLAAVSLDYDQTNLTVFPAQFGALLAYVDQQPWANTNAVVWLGLSLGANHLLDVAMRHDGPQPQILILLSSQGRTGRFARERLAPFPHPVLLLQGEQDIWFPWMHTEDLFEELTSEGVPAGIKVFPGLGHGLEPERGVILRCLGEYCLTQLGGPKAWQEYTPPAALAARPAWWLCWLPAALWWLGWSFRRRGARAGQSQPPTPNEMPVVAPGLWALATLLAAWVLAVGFVCFVTPQLPISRFTLALAQRWLAPATERADFDYLARQPAWAGQPLQRCLDQIQLAGFVRRHFNLRGDAAIYRAYCLSPFINGWPGEAADWRRPFWAEFAPAVDAETNPVAAAAIVVRHLRENVCVLEAPGLPEEVSGVWRRRVTDVNGFETTYVAALRSVGIPARLDANHLAELWNGAAWKPAPAPALMAW